MLRNTLLLILTCSVAHTYVNVTLTITKVAKIPISFDFFSRELRLTMSEDPVDYTPNDNYGEIHFSKKRLFRMEDSILRSVRVDELWTGPMFLVARTDYGDVEVANLTGLTSLNDTLSHRFYDFLRVSVTRQCAHGFTGPACTIGCWTEENTHACAESSEVEIATKCEGDKHGPRCEERYCLNGAEYREPKQCECVGAWTGGRCDQPIVLEQAEVVVKGTTKRALRVASPSSLPTVAASIVVLLVVVVILAISCKRDPVQ